MSRLPIALALVVLVAGCKKNQDDSADTDDTLYPGLDTGDSGSQDVDLYGHPRFLHLAADLTLPCDHDSDPLTDDMYACIDLYAAGSPVSLNGATPFPFGGSTSYPVPVPPLPYTFNLYTTGADISTATPLLSPQVEFLPGEYKSIVVYGNTQVAGHFSTVIDDDPTPPSAGKAKVRVFHAHNVQMILGGRSVDVAIGATPVATDLQYGHVSEFVEVDPGTDLQILLDTNADNVPDNAGLITLAEGQIAELMMVDSGYFPTAGAPWYIFLAHSPTTQEPEIVGTQALADLYGHPRLVHLASELAPPCDYDDDPLTPDGFACLDLYLPGNPTALNGDDAFPFGASTSYPLPFQPGTVQFDLYAHGADIDVDDPVLSPQATFAAGQYKTIVTHGSTQVAGITTTVIDDNPTPPTAGKAKARVFHAHNAQLALGGLPITVLVGTTPIASNLQYAHASEYVEVTPGAGLTLALDTNGDSVPDNAGVVTLTDGQIADLFLVDTGYFPDPSKPWYLFLLHTPTSQEPGQYGTIALADVYGHPRFVNVAPDVAPPCDHDGDAETADGLSCLDLYIRGRTTPLNGDIPFPFGGSTSYPLPFQPMTFLFDLYAYGDVPGTDTPVLSPQVTFTAGTYSTIVLYGSSAITGYPTYKMISDDLAPPASGNAKVRVFHANNAELGLAGMGVGNSTVQVNIGATSIVDNLQFGFASGYVEVAAGTNLTISLDSDNSGAPDNFGVITLADGEIADLFLVDTGYFPQAGFPWFLFLKYAPESEEPELVGVIVP